VKTKEQVMQACLNEGLDDSLGRRFTARFCDFCTEEEIKQLRFTLQEGEIITTKEWTEENVFAQLKKDVAFGFEKALDQRGLSASAMNSCILCWMWVLEDELQGFELYAQYGLPLLKAVAVKYGFENPIGDDSGSEDKYAG
jgi:hypothetical protein